MEIGIVGYGIVGKATEQELKDKVDYIYDPLAGYVIGDISKCDILFICINEKDPTMKNLDKVIDDLIKINTKAIFVIRTTVIPGTTDRYSETYKRDFVFMPEFIREWNVEYDTFHPDKVVIGTENIKIWEMLYVMFSYLIEASRIIRVKPIEAEMAKLALNSLALIKVVFAEEIYDLTEHFRADYKNIYKIFQLDQNVNERHLLAGKDGYRGASGKCLSKDADFLLAFSGASNMGLLKLAIELNKHYLKKGIDNEKKSIQR